MKKKNFETKLVFNKETVANLRHEEMRGVYGGVSESTCPECPPDPSRVTCETCFCTVACSEADC